MRKMTTIFGIVLIALLAGCASGKEAVKPSPWLPEYETPWNNVQKCYGSQVGRPDIYVRTDCFKSSGGWLIYKTSASETGYATGEFDSPKSVYVCPDLKALKHEMSHYVHYKLKGWGGVHTSGKCFDVKWEVK